MMEHVNSLQAIKDGNHSEVDKKIEELIELLMPHYSGVIVDGKTTINIKTERIDNWIGFDGERQRHFTIQIETTSAGIE